MLPREVASWVSDWGSTLGIRASALSEHVSPVVVIPAEASSPDSEPVLEKDDLMGMDASQQVRTS